MNTIRKLQIGVAILGALLFISAAAAEDKIVITEGISGLSYEDALRQAQRMAVEEAVGVFVQSETEIENFELKKDSIFSRTEGYIRRFDVLERQDESGTYRVRIQAAVSLDRIKDDLLAMKILLDSMERPKLMVLVAEDYKSMDHLGMGIAATQLSARLQSRGFELVDQAQVAAVQQQSQGRQALAGNAQAAKMLGLQFGAQYVITGKAVVQDAGEAYEGSGLRSIQAAVQLTVVQTQTGLILGSHVSNGVAAHISPLNGATTALQLAVEKSVDEYLVDAITASFQDYLNNGMPLKLHVSGVASFQQYKTVSDAIEGLNRIVSSKKEGWNKAGGLLILDLRFRGTSEELAEILDGLAMGENKLEVVDFAPARVNCNLL